MIILVLLCLAKVHSSLTPISCIKLLNFHFCFAFGFSAIVDRFLLLIVRSKLTGQSPSFDGSIGIIEGI